jgi:hypothetical protein
MTKPALYQRVALRRDVSSHGLKAGDVATLLEYVEHPTGGPQGCVLEVFNALGDSIAVVAVEAADIEPLNSDEVLSVRRLAQAG